MYCLTLFYNNLPLLKNNTLTTVTESQAIENNE